MTLPDAARRVNAPVSIGMRRDLAVCASRPLDRVRSTGKSVSVVGPQAAFPCSIERVWLLGLYWADCGMPYHHA